VRRIVYSLPKGPAEEGRVPPPVRLVGSQDLSETIRTRERGLDGTAMELTT
jgi:hypothetical protein